MGFFLGRPDAHDIHWFPHNNITRQCLTAPFPTKTAGICHQACHHAQTSDPDPDVAYMQGARVSLYDVKWIRAD